MFHHACKPLSLLRGASVDAKALEIIVWWKVNLPAHLVKSRKMRNRVRIPGRNCVDFRVRATILGDQRFTYDSYQRI